MNMRNKTKMYIEIKPNQEEKVTKGNYKRTIIDIEVQDDRHIRCRTWHGTSIDDTIDFLRNKGLRAEVLQIDETKIYRTVRGHKIKRLGKNDLVIPVGAADLESVLDEVKKVEQELRNLGIKYERKCTWVCGM